MDASPFASAVEALLSPLRFAARNDFAHLGRVRDLERSAREAASRAAGLAAPEDAIRVLRGIEDRFRDPLDPAPLRAAVGETLAEAEPLADPAWSAAALRQPVSVLPGIGPRRQAVLERRGLGCIADLLYRLPTGYDDRRELVRVDQLEVGLRATFMARVLGADTTSGRRGRRGRFGRTLQVVVGDETGTVNLKWFRGGDALASVVETGNTLLVTGDVRRYRFAMELLHPDVEVLETSEGGAPAEPAAMHQIVPRYPALEGIPPRVLRRMIVSAVDRYADLVSGWLPEPLARERALPAPALALRALHQPDADSDPVALREGRTGANERLVLEELYLLELGLALRRAQRMEEPGLAIASGPRTEAALDALPFELTAAQRRVVGEIRADLARPHPMNRLLQGDVGSGKTAVAFLAALAVVERGGQAALMAPTELLAEQHARTLLELSEAGGDATRVRIGLLTASVPRAEAREIRSALAAGELDVAVGTHALVQSGVQFASLGLGIVDEQHRFGVLQRAALAERSASACVPHVLVMTATPIPRTLALTVYGELDLSVLDEMPPGRVPVETHVLRRGEGGRVVEALRATLDRGEQAYVVYPLVEESEKVDLRAVTESTLRIRQAFPEAEVDLVHGRLDAAARTHAMQRFARGEVQILVSTTVIEVGVDVPSATLMVVEHAERFGLAQLHQLRGRVGRDERPGTCLLLARGGGEDSEARLRAMLETRDGFAIADADLRIRGPGEFLGTRQSGRLPDLRLADLVRDGRLVAVAREAALAAVRSDPGLAGVPALRRAVEARWGDRLALARVG